MGWDFGHIRHTICSVATRMDAALVQGASVRLRVCALVDGLGGWFVHALLVACTPFVRGCIWAAERNEDVHVAIVPECV